jgi:hypothetical protein
MIRYSKAIPLMAILALASCGDSSPTANEPEAGAAAFELVAEAALEVNDKAGTPLPSLDHLLRRTWRAIREYDGHGEGVRLLKTGHTLRGIISVLGPEVAVEGLAGVRAALDGLYVHIGDKVPPDHMQKALDMAETQWERGASAMADGNPAEALGAALGAAHWIRSLSPRYRARKVIERATRALTAAVGVAGDGPTLAERTALGEATRLRNRAVEAFQVKHFREAWDYARESIAFSHEVLKGRSDG